MEFQGGSLGGVKTLIFSNDGNHFTWFKYFSVQNGKNYLEFQRSDIG